MYFICLTAKMECIICGKTNNNNTFWNLQNDNDVFSFKRNIFSSWKRECITATCQVLFGSKSEYFVDYFQNAKYCSCCEQVVRDLGFTWKQIKSFQKQIFQLSRKINNLLDANYNQIEEKSEADVVADRISTLSLVKNETPDFSNYSFKEMVEIIFTLISSPQNSVDPHTHSFESPSFSTKSWTQQTDAEFNINTDNNMGAESLHSLKSEEDFDVDCYYEDDFQDISPSEENLLTSFKEENSIQEYDNIDIGDCAFEDNENKPSLSSNRSDDITKNERAIATEKSSENISSLGTMESKDNSLKCPFESCNLYFDTEYNQQTHFYLTHGFETPYMCPGCPLKYIHEHALRSHLKRAHDESMEYNRCSYCGVLHKNKEQLTFHYSIAHQEPNPFKCAFCVEIFKSREYLLNHTSKSHPNSIKEEINKLACSHCDKKLACKTSLNKHVQLKHPKVFMANRLECKFCGKKYTKEENLKFHYSISHQDPNPFQCAFCSALYTNREDLIVHTKDHSGWKEKHYICKLCKQNFAAIESLKVHSTRDHTHKCSFCEMRFTTLALLISHMEQQHEPNLKCDECGKSFPTLKICLHHKENAHIKRVHKCKICGMILGTPSELRAHQRYEHELRKNSSAGGSEECQDTNQFICGFCSKNFNNYNTLREHVNEFHSNQINVGQFKCGVCGGYYTSLLGLYKHLQNHCRPSLPSCKFCGKGYNTEEELNAHNSKAHQGSNPFTCAFCPEIFNNSRHLIRHTQQVHADPESLLRKFKCGECGAYMATKSGLYRHSLIFHRDPSLVFKCKLCSTPFKDEERLENHMKVTHAEQQFICDTCGRIFKTLTFLKSHSKIHDETARNVQCKVCDKMFIDTASCRKHEKTHTDIKDFFCDICGKGFLNKGNLKEHRKIHTGEPTRKRCRKKMS